MFLNKLSVTYSGRLGDRYTSLGAQKQVETKAETVYESVLIHLNTS